MKEVETWTEHHSSLKAGGLESSTLQIDLRLATGSCFKVGGWRGVHSLVLERPDYAAHWLSGDEDLGLSGSWDRVLMHAPVCDVKGCTFYSFP